MVQISITKLLKRIQIPLVLFGFMWFGMMPVFAASPPPDPTDVPNLTLDLGGEAYVQSLPMVNQSSTGSEWFKQRFADIIGSILDIVMTVGALMLLLYLLWGALSWITSAGDKTKTEEARNRMTSAIIGIIILSSTVALFMFVQQILGICVLDFWNTACTSAPVAPIVP